eukprot:scaffold88016_cov39-Phaeocystis_antarctica.AAC.4
MALTARLLWSLGWLVRRRSGCGPPCRLEAEAVDAAASSSSSLSAMEAWFVHEAGSPRCLALSSLDVSMGMRL